MEKVKIEYDNICLEIEPDEDGGDNACADKIYFHGFNIAPWLSIDTLEAIDVKLIAALECQKNDIDLERALSNIGAN